MIDRDGTTGNAGTSSAWSNRYEVLIRQFDDRCYFFCRFREYDYFRGTEPIGVAFFISLIRLQFFRIYGYAFFSQYFFQFVQ